VERTPAHEHHNPDVLRLVPLSATRLIEVGCSSGALAREVKKLNPACRYLGIDIDERYAELAARYCDETLVADVENLKDEFFDANRLCNCWIFGDTLEHLKDPWRVLRSIRRVISHEGCVIACIPNLQHWSLQVKIGIGSFRYEDSGLMDRTHLRWFTRKTIAEMFIDSGFAVTKGISRIFEEPDRERFLPLIGELARLAGADPKRAISDALPLQYVLRAEPRQG